MSRPGITKDQVFEAAEALAAEGENPTVTRIRAKLSGGSPNTITPFLKEWRDSHQAATASAAPDLPDTVMASFRAVWSAAYSEASRQLEGERAALEITKKEMEQERTELSAEIDRLDTALEAAESAQAETTAALIKEREASEKTRAKAATAEVQATERGTRIEAMTTELESVRHSEREARDDAAELRGQITAMLAKADKKPR